MYEWNSHPWGLGPVGQSNGFEADVISVIQPGPVLPWDIAAVWNDVGDGDPAANARLIAAAPELAALVDKVGHLNLDADEIGEGMLRQLVDEAHRLIRKMDGAADEA